jgi:hypothetical protein
MRNKMDNNAQRELPCSAFQVWMGQWRLTTLDTEGCLFVLRFLLRAFSSRRPDDRFWRFLREFLFADQIEDDSSVPSAKELITCAGGLKPDQARALVAYLGECYAAETDRQFWLTISEAIQLYTVAPYTGRAAGSA